MSSPRPARRQGWRPRPSCQGISLLEVIVALVIVATFGVALFAWAGQTFRATSQVADLQARLELELGAADLARSINPAAQPKGRLVTPLHVYEWQAEAIRQPADHVKHPAGISPYQVTLYKVKLRVLSPAGDTVLLDLERWVAGHQLARVRPSGPPGFSGLAP